MKVAVSSLGTDPDDRVDDRFGRAMHFIIVDTETEEVLRVDNDENRNALQGAGIASAELVAEHGVAAVITGHLGPKAFHALRMAGIGGYRGSGMAVDAAVEAFEAGTLALLSEADEAHGA
ncbi:MAG: NifB/NifX family molybdenum-iron cluster-binding protein [Anaerosomatales bacterium]|nr:NifB/NifX family molybdenum-iron cluster-binding protein [Anaerosomatales bacterium]